MDTRLEKMIVVVEGNDGVVVVVAAGQAVVAVANGAKTWDTGR